MTSNSLLRNRNLLVLFCAQCLALTCAPAIVLLGGLVGKELAPGSAWVTFPVAASIVGTAVASLPAALLMQRFGRRAGLSGAVMYGALAALMAATAIAWGNFWLFSLSFFGMGMTIAFMLQFRFAAAESVAVEQMSRAISLLMLSGIVSAWVGPEVVELGADQPGLPPYSGSFVGIALLMTCGALVLLGFKNQEMTETDKSAVSLPLKKLITPPIMLAVLGGMTAFSVMSLVMTATPVEMHHGVGHSLDRTSLVIQSHIIAMYLPSLVSGHMVARYGVRLVMAFGLGCFAISIGVALAGISFEHFWLALVLLGVAWNLMFVSSTTLLAEESPRESRFRLQAVNEFSVFGTQTLAALGAGWVVSEFGWVAIQWLALPLVLVTALMLAWQQRFYAAGSTAVGN